jgi:hypothetical protein
MGALWVFSRAKDLLQKNLGLLHKVAGFLMVNEQMDGEDFQRLLMESQAEAYIGDGNGAYQESSNGNGAVEPSVSYA